MNIRLLAERDLGKTLEDEISGFGWPITLTNPQGVVLDTNPITGGPLTGQSNDIAQIIDPETGQAVSGRIASVVLRLSTLYAANFQIPRAIPDIAGKPWLVRFEDINGIAETFKVSETNPDRTLGVVVCILEVYETS